MSGPGTGAPSPTGLTPTTIAINDARLPPDTRLNASAISFHKDLENAAADPPSPSTTQMSGELEPTIVPEDDEPDWPAGWRPWVALAGCFFLMFNSWGLVNAFGTFATFYKEMLLPGYDLHMFNLIGSTESFVVLVLSFFVGRLLDAGFSRYILCTGFALVTIGMFTLSVSSGDTAGSGSYINVWLTQGLTTGLGMSCFFVASSQIAATWFTKRKSFAIGVVASGASIAGLVYPFMIRELIEQLGWSLAVKCTATLTAVTALFSAIAAQPNPAHPLNKNSPYKWVSVRRWVDPPAFKFSPFNWFCAAIALMFFGFYAVFFNLEEWALHKQLGKTNERGPPDHEVPVFYYLATMNGASTIGRVLSGWLSDKFGALHVHFVVMFVASILLLAMWTTVNNVAGAFAFVILFGAFSGAVIGMPPATIAHLITHAPDTDHSRMGHWTGMMYTIAAPFALVGPVIAGYLITRFNMNFLTVQLWSGFCLFLSSLCIAMSMYYMHRESMRVQKVRSFARSIFDSESRAGSIFRSGNVTAVQSTYPSDNEKEDDEKTSTRRSS